MSKTVLYQSIGEELVRWDVDVESATLTRRESIMLPSKSVSQCPL